MTLALTQDAMQSYLLGHQQERGQMLPRLAAGYGISREQRLDIYHNAYRARLRETLETVFERTWAYIGDEEFASQTTRYIESHPSTSRNMRDYGADFPTFLHAAMPVDGEVAELAQMDWLLNRAFDAPNSWLLTQAQLTLLSEKDWASAVFVFHPSVSMSVFNWNVLEIWHALDNEVTPPAAQELGRPVAHLFWRRDLAGQFRSLADNEYGALRDLSAGRTFAQICEMESAEQAAVWLRHWVSDELLVGVRLDATVGEEEFAVANYRL